MQELIASCFHQPPILKNCIPMDRRTEVQPLGTNGEREIETQEASWILRSRWAYLLSLQIASFFGQEVMVHLMLQCSSFESILSAGVLSSHPFLPVKILSQHLKYGTSGQQLKTLLWQITLVILIHRILLQFQGE